MLQYGDIVKIKYSRALLELGLCELVNREAMVVKPMQNKKHKDRGAFVVPKTGRLKDEEWYIPIQSIDSLDSLNKLRTKSIIRQTSL